MEEIAKASDEKRKRGESTAPPPTPTMPIKQRRFDVPVGTLQRPLNPGVDSLDEINSTGQIMVHTPSPQGPQSIRFPGHAQAAAPPAQVVQTSHPAPIASEQIQHPQGQQIVPPGRTPRGPTLGYFNTERVRPILQAATPQHQQPSVAPDATRAQRTIIAAHEAQLEVQQALRKEQQARDHLRDQQLREQQQQQLREQQQRDQQQQQLREQQQRDQQLREQQQQQLREQQQRDQQLREQQQQQLSQQRDQQLREQQLREQQHREQLREQQLRDQQREQQLRDQQREQQLRDQLRDQQLRDQKLQQQIRDQQIRDQQVKLREQQLREQQAREIREQQMREQQAREMREQQIRELTAREQLREQQAREQQNRDQQARQQHIRPKQEMEIPPLSQYEKYSAPSQQSTAPQPREGPPIYSSDVRHSIPASQYGPRTIPNLRKVGNDAANSGSTSLPNAPQHLSRSSMNGPSINQELPATSRPQAPSVAPVRQQETVRKTSNIMSLLNEEPSDIRPVLKREAASHPSASPAPQGLYQQNRPLAGTQPPPIRRETPLGDIHTAQNYPRSTSSSQGPVRVVESSYPVVAQPQSQQSRSHAGSPMEPTSTTEFEYYAHQQPYGAHSQQQTPVDSPRLGPAFHGQPQHPHRTMAFGASTQRTASPPSQYAPSHPVRHENFDGRFPIPPHSRYNSSGSVTPAPYPPTTQIQHPMSSVRLTSSQSSAPQVQLTSQMPPQPPQPLQPQPQQHQQPAPSHSYAPLPTHPNMQHHIQSGPARSFSPPRPPTYDSRGYAEQQGQQQPPQPTAIMRRQLIQTQQPPQHLLPHQQREQRE